MTSAGTETGSAEEPEFPIDAVVEIGNDDFLIRKIPAVPHIQPNGIGARRVSKSAFSASSATIDPAEGMSASCERLLQQGGTDIQSFASEFPVLARLNVGSVRALGLLVVHHPVDGDPAHCQVFGVKERHRKKLLGLAEFVRKPADIF